MIAEEIEYSPGLAGVLRRQAVELLAIQRANPRAGGVFATQQRWLLAHLAMSMYFKGKNARASEEFRSANYYAEVAANRIASRNTADAFLKEMLKYGFLEILPGHPDRRVRPLGATEMTIRLLDAWMRIHLGGLDRLDEGDRLPRYARRPASISRIHPLVVAGLLRSSAIRDPQPTFSLFTWLNEGGVMMDWIYSGLADLDPQSERVLTSVRGYADFAGRIRLSRTHLARKLRAAEIMGSLAWEGARGGSAMPVSIQFVREFHKQQSAKLAVIDAAFAQVADHGEV